MKVAKYQPTLSLKPTQFSIGLLEVEYKVIAMRNMSKKKLRSLVREKVIPVVISPWKELCVIDHHHFLFACWHAHVTKVKVKVVKDYSKSRLNYHRFWQKMARERLAYLYDQFGDGPKHALYLPPDIRGMADDPYRSLAWIVRKEGGYENSTETFCEFKWADLFRQRHLLDSTGRNGFHSALPKALRLAKSPAAKDLPGFIGHKKNATLKVKPPKKLRSSCRRHESPELWRRGLCLLRIDEIRQRDQAVNITDDRLQDQSTGSVESSWRGRGVQSIVVQPEVLVWSATVI